MATFDVLSADELALKAADKPALIAQAIPPTIVKGIWTDTSSGLLTDTDKTDTGYPISRIYDGLTHLPTRPNGTASKWSLIIQTELSGVGQDMELDWLGILGYDFSTGTISNIRMIIDGGGNGLFSINWVTTTLSAPFSGRIQEWTLAHFGSTPIRYEDIKVLKLEFNGTGIQPEVNEVIIGRRRQSPRKSSVPFDAYNLEGTHETTIAASGVQTRITHNDGRRRLDVNVNPSEEPYISDIPAFFRESSRYGRSPFVWAEDPGTDESKWAYYMMEDPALRFPVVDFIEHQWNLVGVEQGPERFYLEND